MIENEKNLIRRLEPIYSFSRNIDEERIAHSKEYKSAARTLRAALLYSLLCAIRPSPMLRKELHIVPWHRIYYCLLSLYIGSYRKTLLRDISANINYRKRLPRGIIII